MAGRVGLPVVEYNWYAHQASEGYYEDTGRGGSGVTSFDYDKVKDLPPCRDKLPTLSMSNGPISPTI